MSILLLLLDQTERKTDGAMVQIPQKGHIRSNAE